jgi:sugar lactone lactonase YvrE
MSRLLLVFALVITTACAASASAAELPYQRFGSVFEQPADGTYPIHQQRIAIKRDTGRVYLADVVGDQVRMFDPSGDGAGEVGSFGFGELVDPLGIAVDQDTGAIYVSDAGNIVKYDSSGVMDAFFTSPSVTGPIAFDQNADELVVADQAADVVRRYSPTGAAAGSFDGTDGSSVFTGLQDVAVAPSGDVYVVDSDGDPATGSGTSRVERFSASGSWQLTLGPVQGAATVAVDAAGNRVVVSGNQDAVNYGNSPTLSVFDPAVNTITPVEQIPTPALPSSTIRGLGLDDGPAARLYVASDVEGIYGGYSGNVSLQVYQRPIDPPTVTTDPATVVTENTAKLNGTINPNRVQTRFWFEYGITTSYGQSLPASENGDAGAGSTPVDVVRQPLDLQPGTAYHYRLVATSALGTVHGPDRTFTTTGEEIPEQQAVDNCPNTAIRVRQGTQRLSDCRAYELVSPVNKNGGIVAFPAGTQAHSATQGGLNAATRDGDTVAYWSYNVFENPKTGMHASYRSHRGATGWSTEQWTAATPTTQTPVPGVGPQGLGADAVHLTDATDDLGKGFFKSSLAFDPLIQRPYNPSLFGQPQDVYSLASDGKVSWESRGNGAGPATSDDRPTYAGRSDDGTHVLFQTTEKLVEGANGQLPGMDSLYVRGNGHTTLVADDGTGPVSDCGSFLPVSWWSPDRRGVISKDGSRIVFMAPVYYFGDNPVCLKPRRVYVRDGEDVIEASKSQRAIPDTPTNVTTVAAADASKVFFATDEALTDDADPDTNGLLYEYDVSTHHLRLLVPEGGATSILTVAKDGSSVYFSDGTNLMMYAAGVTKHIADPGGTLSNLRSTSDGRFFVFATTANLTEFDSHGRQEIYMYSADDDGLVCLSCNSSGAVPSGDAQLWQTSDPDRAVMTNLSHNVAPDGSWVIFDTYDALVAQDTNNHSDVYRWSKGGVELISDGKDPFGSFFFDADDSGKSVFFGTASSLVGVDGDRGAQDIYVARSGGGFAGQNPLPDAPACVGDVCQGPAPAGESLPALASLTFSESSRASGTTLGRVSVGGVKSVVGSSGRLWVRVPGAGQISLSGRSVHASRKRASGAAAIYWLRVSLTAKAKKTLKVRRTLRTTVTVRFKPSVGTQVSKSLVLTFKQRPVRAGSKGGR